MLKSPQNAVLTEGVKFRVSLTIIQAQRHEDMKSYAAELISTSLFIEVSYVGNLQPVRG